ncbi:hypothetical protein PENTCL1PPCAC_21946, partial [Pristionchus entomophagus]
VDLSSMIVTCTLLLALLIEPSIGKLRCDYGGYVLVGSYCYYVDDQYYLGTNFAEQRILCESIGGTLPCWVNKEDQDGLVEFVDKSREVNFNSFFIGLKCDLAGSNINGVGHWAWIERNYRYDKSLASFADKRTDPENCSDTNATYLLTPNKEWREFSSFPVGFSPAIAVCQRLPVLDSSTDPS